MIRQIMDKKPGIDGLLTHYVNVLIVNLNLFISIILLGPIITTIIFGPAIVPHSPIETDPANNFASPSIEHPMGTDQLGRDILSRVIIGGRSMLILGFGSVALALALGVPTGLISGYYGGIIDELTMRLMDIFMSFPTLILALLIVSALGSNLFYALVAIGLVFTPKIARIVRSTTLSVANEEYVAASKVQGDSDVYIIFREILPNVMSPIVVEATYRVGVAVIIGASLSFLGLGAQPPHPDWGYMIADAREYIWSSAWIVFFPSLALGLVVIGVNFLGDGLRDILDPKEVDV